MHGTLATPMSDQRPTTPGPAPNPAHHQPHAAAAGPAGRGSRGAMWFALGILLLVVACVIGLVVILGAS